MNIVNNCNEKNRCTRCGKCCTDFAFISDGEIAMIKPYLRAHPEVKEHWAKPINGKIAILCPFYNQEERKCDIYKVRPKICKLFKCNRGEGFLIEMKKQFTADKYHNVADILSWHKIFFNNDLQQKAIMEDAKKGVVPL